MTNRIAIFVYLASCSLLIVGCDIPAEAEDHTAAISHGLSAAILSNSTPAPSTETTKIPRHECDCNDGWITQGDGHRTRCQKCETTAAPIPPAPVPQTQENERDAENEDRPVIEVEPEPEPIVIAAPAVAMVAKVVTPPPVKQRVLSANTPRRLPARVTARSRRRSNATQTYNNQWSTFGRHGRWRTRW